MPLNCFSILTDMGLGINICATEDPRYMVEISYTYMIYNTMSMNDGQISHFIRNDQTYIYTYILSADTYDGQFDIWNFHM